MFGLTDYAREHLSTEERILELHDYPDLESHKETYTWFIGKLLNLNDAVRKDKLGVAIEMLQFLADWFYKHIKGTDQQYVTYFAEQGIDLFSHSSPVPKTFLLLIKKTFFMNLRGNFYVQKVLVPVADSFRCDRLQSPWICVVGKKGSRRALARLRALFTFASLDEARDGLTTGLSLDLA